METAILKHSEIVGNIEALAQYSQRLQTSTNEEIINAFLCDTTANRKANTKIIYGRVLNEFCQFLNAGGLRWQNVTPQIIGAFRDDLKGNGKKPNTINGYLSAVRALFRFISASGAGFDVAKPVANVKTTADASHLPIFAEECTAIINASRYRTARNNKGEETTKESKRNYAIINLMLRTGLRCAEVSGLNVGDLHQDTTADGEKIYYLQFTGKKRNEKSSFVKLTNKALFPLLEYMEEKRKGAPADAPLFVTEDGGRRGERLGVRSISKLAKSKLQEIGKDGVQYTAHSLRASMASNIYRKTGSVEACQKALRHANAKTTEIYLRGISQIERLQNAKGFDVLDEVF